MKNIKANWVVLLFAYGVVTASGQQDPALLYIFPGPGAEAVPPESPILIRITGSLQTGRLTENTIKVTGDRSGRHLGRFRLSDDAKTLIFYTERPFTEEETVTVQLLWQHPYNGSLTAIDTLWHFKTGVFSEKRNSSSETARPSVMQKPAYPANEDGIVLLNGISVPSDFPYIDISINDNPDPGYIFCMYAGRHFYNLIFNNEGLPVFYWQVPDDRRDFKVQPNGTLTMTVRQDYKGGGYIAVDRNYTVVDTFFAPPGYTIDEHELLVLDNGHYLITATDSRFMDMSRLVPGGKPNASVTGYHLIEMDSHDNPVFIWRCWDHYEVTDAEDVDLTQWNIDFLHTNSIAVDLDGNYLTCPKLLNEITKINSQTGEIIWRLGGKKNDFKYEGFEDNPFYMQHSIRVLPNGNYTVFDNGNYHQPHYSRALEFSVDETAMTARKVWEFRDSPDKQSFYKGNVQRLPNGNTLISWGMMYLPKLTEVKPDGTKAFEMNFREPIESYRVFRFPWNGKAKAPFLVTEVFSNRIHLLFNKFGDNEVAAYQVFGGPYPHPDRFLAETDRPYYIMTEDDFIGSADYYFRVRAVDRNGGISDFSNEEYVRSGFTPSNVNLIQNSMFESKLDGWQFFTTGSAAAEATAENDGLLCDITDPGEDYTDIQLIQNGLMLLAGETYQLELDARAAQSRPIEIRIESGSEPVIDYAKIGLIYLRPENQHFIFNFTLNGPSDTDAVLRMNLGGDSENVRISRIALIRKSAVSAEYDAVQPDAFEVGPVYPNPWNPGTTVRFRLAGDARISLEIMDIRGRIVASSSPKFYSAGEYDETIDGRYLSSGIYFLRFQLAGEKAAEKNRAATLKMMVIK